MDKSWYCLWYGIIVILRAGKRYGAKDKALSNKTVAFNLGISGTKAYYLDAVISNIKSSETGVLIKLMSVKQTRALFFLTIHTTHG